jgi:flavodoxin
MKTLVLYDSVFGNTEKIALALVEAFAEQGEAEAVKAADFSPERLAGVGRLAVGSPTRAFRPTPLLVERLEALSKDALSGVDVLAFDTRAPIEKAPGILKFFAGLFGYAAEPIGKRLRKKGGRLVLPPAGFVVSDTEGPLLDGELARAAAWARSAPTPPAAG